MDGLLEYKATPVEFKATGDKGEYEGHFSVFGNVDDGNDIVHPGAFTKTIQERGKRVKVFYAHDWLKLIGPPPAMLNEDSIGLFAKGRLTLGSFWGREAWALMKDAALTEGSFGYRTIKADTDQDGLRHLRELVLYELSPVPLGMNALTEIRAVKMAIIQAAKSAIPPHTTDKAPEDEAWDAAAVLKQVEGAKQLRLIHAWVDGEGDPEAKSSYKLPHHLPDGKVVWKGVSASGAAIMGSRGGVVLPDSDVAGVKRHLAKHYTQFEKTPPWDESAGLETYLETLAAVTHELKEGRVLSASSKEKVQAAIDAMNGALEALNNLLAAAEPPPKGHSALLQRLRAAEMHLAVLSHQ